MFVVGTDSEIVPHYAGLRKNSSSVFFSSYLDDFTCVFALRTKNKNHEQTDIQVVPTFS